MGCFVCPWKGGWGTTQPVSDPSARQPAQRPLFRRLLTRALLMTSSHSEGHPKHEFSQFVNFTNPVYIGLANERFGEHDRAMLFADAGASSDPERVLTNKGPRFRSLSQGILGRILAARGRTAEAEAAFEAAIAEARACKLFLLECLALRDLGKHLQPPGIADRMRAARGSFGAGAPTGDDLDDLNQIMQVFCAFDIK